MTTSDIRARAAEIDGELAELARKTNWTAADQARMDALAAEVADLERRAELRARAANPSNVELPVPISRDRDRTPQGDARRTIDQAARDGFLADAAAQAATALVETGSPRDRAIASRWAVVTGSPEYRGAFSKLMTGERGHLTWTPAEADAFRAVEEFRAMSLTDAAGGYMVPLTLDPAIMLTGAGSINPLRQIARVVQTTSDTWQGVSSAGVTAEWLAEGAEAADATPTLAGPSIPVYKGSAFVPFSFEIGADAVNFNAEVARLLVDGADQLMATAYTTGTGSGQPTGIITALAGGASVITGGGTEALAVGDPLLLQNALPPRWQAGARWAANVAIINAIGAFETTNGALRFPEVATGQLLRKPLHELSGMDGSINATVTANNYVLLYGDFTNFVIADRIGTTVELIPNLMGANRRPTGQRGLFMWFRSGSDSVNDDAFRLLNVPTTA